MTRCSRCRFFREKYKPPKQHFDTRILPTEYFCSCYGIEVEPHYNQSGSCKGFEFRQDISEWLLKKTSEAKNENH